MDASTRFAVLPQAREYGIRCFPPCLSPCPGTNLHGNAFIDWANRNSSAINSALDVHGAILFRGFGGLDPQYFSQFVGALGAGTFPYSLGNAVRTLIVGGKNEVFTANESPPDRPIPFHHELAQVGSGVYACGQPLFGWSVCLPCHWSDSSLFVLLRFIVCAIADAVLPTARFVLLRA